MLKLSNFSIYLGYSVSAISFVFGIIIVSGFAFLDVPIQMRLMFGIVLMLWGVYRFVMTRTRIHQQHEDEEE